MLEPDEFVWREAGKFWSRSQLRERRMSRAELERPSVYKISVCQHSPMRCEQLVAPLAEAVLGDGLPGLLYACDRWSLGVQVIGNDDPSRVRVEVHWRCCFDTVAR